MFDAALKYAAHGYRIFPLKPRDKVPDCAHGCNDATVDQETIRAWWGERPDRNIGIATGEATGRVVIDIDGPIGEESWAAYVMEHDGSSMTLTARTSRGRHLYYVHPGGRVGNRAAILPGVDVRGDGGYVVAPPSVHPSGDRYRWEMASADVAPLWSPLRELIVTVDVDDNAAPWELPDDATPPPDDATTEAIAILREAWPSQGTGWHDATIALCGGCLRSLPHETARTIAVAVAGSRPAEPGKKTRPGEVPEALATTVKRLEAGARVTGWPDLARLIGEDAVTAARKALGLYMANGTTPRDDAPPPTDDDAPSDVNVEANGWRDRLLRTASKPDGTPGNVRPTLGNARVYMQSHPDLQGHLSHDVRRQVYEWTTPPPWAPGDRPHALRKADAVDLASWLQSREHVAFSVSPLLDAMEAECEARPYDLVNDYLTALSWDGTARVETWLSDHLGAPSTPYTAAVGAAWLVSAVARVLSPGCQSDHMLVLEGPQGVGKSRSLAALGGRFYADVSLDPGDKDSVMALHGPWLVEWGELAGMSRRESEAVKAFVSRRTDRVRPSYGRYVLDLPRRCVLAATTNDNAYATDITGNRRYWPVVVTRTRPRRLEAARDHLWAEAVEMYHAGANWWLDPETETLAAEEQADRTGMPPWMETIDHAIHRGQLSGRGWVSSSDLLGDECIGLRPRDQTTAAAREVARIMARIGWPCTRRRRGTEGYLRGYSRPEGGQAPISGPGAMGEALSGPLSGHAEGR
ncbi:MAG: bifunctional DNA primase/polymerase [Deltaproteobacteria bacterium]|nr:bifunctional DNA primase/polymerase [Deltaproteobacteria bacterium]